MKHNSSSSNNLQTDANLLLNYLPIFNHPDFNPTLKWKGGKKDERGILHVSYPIYDEKLKQFFKEFYSIKWSDHDYDPQKVSKLIHNDKLIAKSSLADIKSMLTYCARGERFCDGFWGGLIKDKTLVKILQRLKELVQ